ncbi:MAG: hypothetical protein JO353_13020 [Phycisphaerae bacterium]|nr:hypothetical protein [Phycisphaerae bacterium]
MIHRLSHHAIVWIVSAALLVTAFAAPWWGKIIALFLSVHLAALYSSMSPLVRVAAAVEKFIESSGPLMGLVPYIDPVRPSNRTGQVVYQFVKTETSKGKPMNSSEWQLIFNTLESLLAIFVPKVTSKLTPATQQQVTTAVTSVVSAVGAIVIEHAKPATPAAK